MTPPATATTVSIEDREVLRIPTDTSALRSPSSNAPPVSLSEIVRRPLDDGDTLLKVASSWLRLVTSWHEEEGMEGMKEAFETVKRKARSIDDRIQFTAPEVTRISDDEGDEVVFVSSSVLVPKDMDRMAFRDIYFERIAAALRPADLVRLALGVRPLEPEV